jgi:MSHA biogenesis protein MshL
MKKTLLWAFAAVLCACSHPSRQIGVDPAILSEVDPGTRKPPSPPAAVSEALLPPLRMDMPDLRGQPLEPRFDLSVNNAPAVQVFMSIASGTRYSMLVHPQVAGTLSVNLKDVTIREALDAIRELYGYDYKIDGSRVFIQPAGLQTRIFQVNYLTGQRRGFSDVRVQSGAVTDAGTAPTASAPAGTAPASRSLESSRVTTQQQSDFWAELRTALVALVGAGEGRSVIINPLSGVVLVRALPGELRAVGDYLRATRVSVERQVMLEAKILEVTLSEAFQAGINWQAFRSGNTVAAGGQVSGSTTLAPSGSPLIAPALIVDPAARLASTRGADGAAGAVFSLALQARSFAALLTFLESQGNVQVLSSPRIATINNNKAVLKVGTDEFFVTNVTTTATTTGTSTVQSPSVTLQPFFSGIVLDVTPQIDENNNIILHIHPAVSEVTESVRVVNLGSAVAEIRLPLAKSSVSESDTVVRVVDGNIVAIGGLMSVDIRDTRGGIPGVSDSGLGSFLRSTDKSLRKKELVILLKPTIVDSDRDWEQDVRDTRRRMEGMR